MEEIRPSSGSNTFGRKCLSFCLTAILLCFVSATKAAASDEIPDSTDPVLISTVDSTRALATHPGVWRGALPRRNAEVFQPGASVVLFVTNVDLMKDEAANAFKVFAEDAAGKQYRLTVEDVRQLPRQDWIYALTVRLNDQNEYNGQPPADGDVLVRVSWRGNTSNRVRLGLGATGGAIKDDAGALPTPAPAARPARAENFGETGADRRRFMQQAAFGPTPALDLRLRQLGLSRWIEEQFNVAYPTFPYPNFALKNANNVNDPTTGCGASTDPNFATCQRDHYTQYQNQNWLVKEALYGNDQLRRRISWALHQIWVVSGVDTQQQRWMQEYYEILDKHAFGNYRNLMKEMTLNPAMGNYLDMVRSTRQNPNENYPREILQLFSIGLDLLNQDGTPILDANGNRIPTYDQEKVNQFTKVFTGWTFCSNNTLCPNIALGATNFIDPMMLNSANHDLTAKTLFNYAQVNNSPAPYSTIPACSNCTTDATRSAYANASLDQTLDNIFYHPNVAPFVGKLLIQHLVTSDPSPAYVARVSAAFNNNGAGVRGDMKAVIRAILLDPEARGSRKTAPDYGKLREPFQLATNLMRTFDVKSADRTQPSDGYINPQINAMGQNLWNPPTVFNYYPPDYVVPGTDVAGPEFGITNTGTSFQRINFINTMVYSRVNGGGFLNPLGTSLGLTEPISWATADSSGNLLIENLNARMLNGTMSETMKNTIRTAISVTGMTATQKAQQAVYLVATSSQYQVQR